MHFFNAFYQKILNIHFYIIFVGYYDDDDHYSCPPKCYVIAYVYNLCVDNANAKGLWSRTLDNALDFYVFHKIEILI